MRFGVRHKFTRANRADTENLLQRCREHIGRSPSTGTQFVVSTHERPNFDEIKDELRPLGFQAEVGHDFKTGGVCTVLNIEPLTLVIEEALVAQA